MLKIDVSCRLRGAMVVAATILHALLSMEIAAAEGNAQSIAYVQSKLDADEEADLNDHCGADSGSCHDVTPLFLLQATAPRGAQTSGVEKGFARDFVSIVGAHVRGDLDFRGRKLERGLRLTKCILHGDVDLRGANLRELDLAGCTVKGSVRLDDAVVDRGVILSSSDAGSVVEGALTALRSKIARDLVATRIQVHGPVSLGHAKIGGSLDISQDARIGAVDLYRTRIDGMAWFGRTKVCGRILAPDVSIGGNLVIDQVEAWATGSCPPPGAASGTDRQSGFENVILNGAKIDGDLRFDAAKLNQLHMADVAVKGRLVGVGAILSWISMNGARVSGDADFSHVELKGWKDKELVRAFNAANLSVGGSLSLGLEAQGQVELHGARIGRDLSVGGERRRADHPVSPNNVARSEPPSTEDRTGPATPPPEYLRIAGPVSAHDVVVGGSIYVAGNYEEGVGLARATVGANVEARAATVKGGLNFGGSSITGEFRGWPKMLDDGKLSLRNVKAGALSDKLAPVGTDCKPAVPILDTEGFTYDRLSGFDGVNGSGTNGRIAAKDSAPQRDVGWFTCMLGRDTAFSFQPYRQLAQTFANAGDPDSANTVLRAANLRELRVASCQCARALLWECLVAAKSAFVGLAVGWGLGTGYFLPVVWTLVFGAIGARVLSRGLQKCVAVRPRGWRFCASVSQFLPIIVLDKEFKDYFEKEARNELTNRARVYFRFHAVAGYFVAACIGAGLAGLTQAR